MASGELIAHFLELLAPFGACTARKMFGGFGVYRGPRMIGLVAGDELYLKVDAETRAVFEAEGSRPFVYGGRGKPIEMSYWTAPEAALEDPDEMVPWAKLALAAAERGAAAKSGRAPKRARKRR